MAAAGYQVVLGGDAPRLSARVETCTASCTGILRWGASKTRLCFNDPALDKREFRIAMKGECCSCLGNFSPFTVISGGRETSVFLNDNSLMKRLGVKERLIRKASDEDDLSLLVRYKLFLNEKPEQPVHFSARDYDCGTSFYSGPAFEARAVKRLVGKGAYAKVKEANMTYPPGAPPIVRRIWTVKERDEDKVSQVVEDLKTYCGRPNVIPLLGLVEYKDFFGKHKVVSLHPRIKGDLINFLHRTSESREKLPPDVYVDYGGQMFTALHSLDGAHRDLKLDHYLVDDEARKLYLIDFEVRIGFTEDEGTRYVGSLCWIPPEMFYQMERPLEKRDSWALGIILLYLFTSPFDEPLPWQQTENAEQVRNLLGPRAVNACLAKAYPIIRANHPAKGEAICALISKMVRVDPNERISITDARKEYREKIQGIPA